MYRFIVPNLVNLWSFRKIRSKLLEIWEPKFASIFKEMYARGASGWHRGSGSWREEGLFQQTIQQEQISWKTSTNK